MSLIRKKTAIAIAVLALVAAACSSTSLAATVDAAEIDDQSVLALGGQTGDEGRVDGELFRQSLTFLVLQAALVSAAQSDFGIDNLLTDEGRSAFLANATDGELEAVDSEIAAGIAQGRDPAAVEDFIVTQVALRSLVRKAITHIDAVVEAAWEQDADALVTVCASHILVASEAEANDVIDRIKAGEAFEDVATEVSLDTQSPGGALPCPTHVFTFVQSFADVVGVQPVGELSDPVATDFGFHVVRVDQRDAPGSLEELKGDPERWIPVQLIDAEYTEWLDDAVGRADIWIRSQIGHWNPQLDSVGPPPASP